MLGHSCLDKFGYHPISLKLDPPTPTWTSLVVLQVKHGGRGGRKSVQKVC